MTLRHSAHPATLLSTAAFLCLAPVVLAQTANPLAPPKPLQNTPTLKTHPKPVDPNAPPPPPDRSAAYYHDGLAHLYEELAIANGRPDYAAQAVEEYKLALNADPTSQFLQDGLADLYFKIGRIREAVTAAQDQVRKNPDDIAAHTLLGKVYLRSLGDMQGAQAGEMLQLAIAEYQTLARLKPKDLETHLLLGQLYGLNHDTARAEAEFKTAQSLDSNSEEAVLNMARLYSEQGETQQAIDALTAIPADDRSARVDFALGASYDQLRKWKLAAAAYRAALDDEPDNPDTERALAAALLNDNQLAAALPVYQQLAAADPTDVESQLKVSEIQRRQGNYDDALVTLNKAKASNANAENPELSFNEAVLYDSLGKYDDAVAALKQVLNQTLKVDGRYSEPEKNNRAIFLSRLGNVYREQNKTPEAVAAYKEMIALGGDYALNGYQGEVDALRDAHQWKDAAAAAGEASKAFPDNTGLQLLYAFQLADTGQPDQAVALVKAQLKGGPEDRDTLVTLSNIDLRLHRSADAQAALDKADALSSKPDDHLYIDLQRATIYDHDKQYDKAEAEYRKALAIDPSSPMYPTVLNDFGYMLADRGINLPEALTLIKKAVELDPQNGAFLDSLGWVYFKLGQYGPAEENLRKAIDRQSTDPSLHDHLGEIYEKTGRLKLAVTQWERSMTEYAHTLPADADPADVAKVKRKLDDARIKLAKLNTSSNKKSE
jgi:tetratricopeptide (TPR) repeat protein